MNLSKFNSNSKGLYWDKIAAKHTDDEFDSVICIGGEKSLNRYINKRHQEEIWKYSSGLKIGYYLDAACGTGRFLKKGQFASEVAVGLDFSSNMLQVAKSNVPGAGLVRGDLTDLPYKNNTFDLSTCVITLKLLTPEENFLKCISELIRVSKKHGKVVIIEDVRKKKVEANGIIIHTPQQIIEAFGRYGADLDIIAGIRIAHLIRWYKRFTGLLLRFLTRNKISKCSFPRKSRLLWLHDYHPAIYSIYLAGLKGVLFFNKLIDRFFAPKILQDWATEKIFVFKKR